jgi:hypothetical protein
MVAVKGSHAVPIVRRPRTLGTGCRNKLQGKKKAAPVKVPL